MPSGYSKVITFNRVSDPKSTLPRENEESRANTFYYKAHCEQEPVVNSSACSSLKLFMRNIAQFVTGTARDLGGEENLQQTQDPVDPMEVSWKPFALNRLLI